MIATLAPAKPKLLTAEDLLRLDSKGVKGELIRGEFCEGVSPGFQPKPSGGVIVRNERQILRRIAGGNSQLPPAF